MNKNNFNQHISKILEKTKWFFIWMFSILLFFINYYFYEKSLFIRLITTSLLIITIISIILLTQKGKRILSYIKISQKEMQKIIWPNYKETLYTTFIIISVTVIMSLVLWILDSIIFRLIAFIINFRL